MEELRWCGGVVKNISDGTWVKPGKRCKCYKEKKAAFSFWDAFTEADYPASRLIETFDEKKWNTNCDGTWRKELRAVDYDL